VSYAVWQHHAPLEAIEGYAVAHTRDAVEAPTMLGVRHAVEAPATACMVGASMAPAGGMAPAMPPACSHHAGCLQALAMRYHHARSHMFADRTCVEGVGREHLRWYSRNKTKIYLK
jgi:hypothetical protein